MSASIAHACILLSILSFVAFLGGAIRLIFEEPRTVLQSPVVRDAKELVTDVSIEDLTKIVQAGQGFVDALSKAAPHLLSLVASIIFMSLAIWVETSPNSPIESKLQDPKQAEPARQLWNCSRVPSPSNADGGSAAGTGSGG